MRNILHILTLIFLWTNLSFGQTLDKKYIDDWVLNTFPSSQIGENALYILDGILLQNDSLDYKLSKFKRTDITSIDYLDKALTDSLTFCKPLEGVIIMISRGNQIQRSIRETYNNAKVKYSPIDLKTSADINPDNGEPVLIINGIQIDHRNHFEKFNQIKMSQIIGIQFIDKPVNPEIYGANAKNGLIIIVTDDKNIFGNYANLAKINTEQSFATKLTLYSDSTFKYSFKGDMYNDRAIGTFSVYKNMISLSYITPTFNTDTITRDEIINTSPPTKIKVDETFTWKKHTADFWPLELRIKKNKLIVVKTHGDNETDKNMILRKLDE